MTKHLSNVPDEKRKQMAGRDNNPVRWHDITLVIALVVVSVAGVVNFWTSF